MPEYRFYKVGKDGHIAGPAPVAACIDDRSAVKEAHKLLQECDIEIWDGPRLVAYVVADEQSNRRSPDTP